MDKDGIQKKAKEIIASSKIFILSTVDGEAPCSRFMASLVDEGSFSYYMETFSSARKVSQIRRNPNAQPLFFKPDYSEVVTLIGQANSAVSIEVKEKVFGAVPDSTKYFKSFKDEGFGVIEFKTNAIEYFDQNHEQHSVKV